MRSGAEGAGKSRTEPRGPTGPRLPPVGSSEGRPDPAAPGQKRPLGLGAARTKGGRWERKGGDTKRGTSDGRPRTPRVSGAEGPRSPTRGGGLRGNGGGQRGTPRPAALPPLRTCPMRSQSSGGCGAHPRHVTAPRAAPSSSPPRAREAAPPPRDATPRARSPVLAPSPHNSLHTPRAAAAPRSSRTTSARPSAIPSAYPRYHVSRAKESGPFPITWPGLRLPARRKRAVGPAHRSWGAGGAARVRGRGLVGSAGRCVLNSCGFVLHLASSSPD